MVLVCLLFFIGVICDSIILALSGWVLSDAAAWITALATFALSVVGVITYLANHQLVLAARAQAKASDDSISEIRRDRELAHRPFLTFESVFKTPISRATEFAAVAEILADEMKLGAANSGRLVRALLGPKPLDLRVRNIGKGLALECQYFAWFTFFAPGMSHAIGIAYASPRFPLSSEPSEISYVNAVPYLEEKMPLALLDHADLRSEQVVEALVCADQFKKLYRFLRSDTLPQIYPDDYGESETPEWTQAIGVEDPPQSTPPPTSAFDKHVVEGPPLGKWTKVVAEATPTHVHHFDQVTRARLQDRIGLLIPEIMVSESSAEGMSFRREQHGNKGECVVSCGPGPLLTILQSIPDNADVALPIVGLTRVWYDSLRAVLAILAELRVGTAYLGIGLHLAGHLSVARSGLSFDCGPAPPRDLGERAVLTWSRRLPSAVSVDDDARILLLYLLPDLLHSYGYIEYRDVIKWLWSEIL
jgi:hypothetical protein